MYNTKYFIITGLFLIALLMAGCQHEKKILDIHEDENETISTRAQAGALLAVSYEITTYQVYHYDFDTLTELDLAYLNPSEEKQRVSMYLMPDGTVNMTIEELNFKQTINIPHETAPSDVPEIRKTEIIGNNMTFYDGNQSMIGSHFVEMQKQSDLADQIKELERRYGRQEMVRAFETMQGNLLASQMEDMIEKARITGNLTVYCDQLASIRTNLSEVRQGATGASVVIVDRNISRIVAMATYDEMENLTSRTFYGYEKKGAPVPNATRTETLVEVPSGAEVWQITSSKIEKYKIKLN